MKATFMNTKSTVSYDSKEGKRFLRKVIRENKAGAGWCARASARNMTEEYGSESWAVSFEREVPPKNVGDASVEVEVTTDFCIRVSPSQFGTKASFSDAKEVNVPRPTTAFFMYGDVAALALAIINGCDVNIEASHGSTNSSQHGIGTTSVRVSDRKNRCTYTIGNDTMYVNGSRVISGAAE